MTANGHLESAPLLQDRQGEAPAGAAEALATATGSRQSRISSPVLSRRELAASGDNKDAALEAWKRRRRCVFCSVSPSNSNADKL